MTRHLPSMMTLALAVILLLLVPAVVTAAPEGELTWAVHVSLAPSWFDPAETTGIITPFMFLYALHDALVKPMPGNPMAPSLAESWTVSPDGLSYEFALRKGVRFHNGDPLTAEDVKFSMERYRGAASGPFKARIAGVDVVDPYRVRFRFKRPWPDFMTFYGTMATGAGWVVPKKYVEREVRLLHSRGGADPGGQRDVLAQDAEREAPGLQGDPGRIDAAGHAQAR